MITDDFFAPFKRLKGWEFRLQAVLLLACWSSSLAIAIDEQSLDESQKQTMIEREVQIPAKGATLAGTLTLPTSGDDYPVCLMIHGSGPVDRDENIPVQKLNVFNTIAHRLAENGVGSLRYDKRGCAESTGDYYRTSHQGFVEDASACIDFLLGGQQVSADRVVLLGHSEGTIISAELAPRYPELMGIILLAPFVQPLEQILINQAEHMDQASKELTGVSGITTRAIFRLGGGAIAGQERLIKKLKTNNAPTFRFLFRKIPADSLRGLMKLDPPAIYANVQCPTLIIAGEKDIQCDPVDVATIESLIQAKTESHIIPDLTHILRRDPGAPNIFHYPKIMNDPLDEEVLGLIVEWFKKSDPEK